MRRVRAASRGFDVRTRPTGVRERDRTEHFAENGSQCVEIVCFAKNESIDLTVMGTHDRGPIAHMLMGSIAEKIVRKAPCPVVTVRHPEHEFVMP